MEGQRSRALVCATAAGVMQSKPCLFFQKFLLQYSKLLPLPSIFKSKPAVYYRLKEKLFKSIDGVHLTGQPWSRAFKATVQNL